MERVKIPRLKIIHIGGKMDLPISNEEKNKEILSNIVSPREYDVLKELVLTGDDNKTIGNRLFISEKSVKAHLFNLFRKFNAKNRGQLIVKTIKYFHPIGV